MNNHLYVNDESFEIYTYEVSFWFGLWNPNPFVTPSKKIIIYTNETDDYVISELALKELKEYPRTYSSMVKKIQ
jgi:hypothetical protein